MDEHVRWSVVLVVPRSEQFLVLAKGFQPRNANFPGGDSEAGDLTPEDTAVRELYEEAGLRTSVEDLKLMDKWIGERGQPVYAYYVLKFKGRARSSSEGKVFWTAHLARLTSRFALYAPYNKRLLQRLSRVAA